MPGYALDAFPLLSENLEEENGRFRIAKMTPNPICHPFLEQNVTPLMVLIGKACQDMALTVECQHCLKGGMWHTNDPMATTAVRCVVVEFAPLNNKWWG